MTTHEDLITTLAQIEQQLVEDRATVQHLQTALEDCDPRERFALSATLLADLDTPLRPVARPAALPTHFIRGLALVVLPTTI